MTSLFHAYAHEWGCQLQYNPRLNSGFGMADGEGNERNWFKLSKLIRQLRYATKQHRIVSLNFYAVDSNEMLKENAGAYIS